jgi:hypothetical protein
VMLASEGATILFVAAGLIATRGHVQTDRDVKNFGTSCADRFIYQTISLNLKERTDGSKIYNSEFSAADLCYRLSSLLPLISSPPF